MNEPCNRPDCRRGTIDANGLCDACWREPLPDPEPVRDQQPCGAAEPRPTGRSRVGAGIVYVPPAPELDPLTMVRRDAQIPEQHRFCSNCGASVGRSRGDTPGLVMGYCPICRWRFDFRVKLRPRDLVENQYEIIGTLAHGGQGWIFLAMDRRLNGMYCVLKGRRDSTDPEANEVATAELQALAALSHPGIVKIHNLVEHPDRDDPETNHAYIVMEYEPGHSLEHLRRANGGTIEVTQALAYVHAAMPALGYLHEHKFVYCDFKPENTIHADDAVTLVDLGAAWSMGAGPDAPIFATPGFRAPELGATGPTVATDIYAVGRTLAALVCGRWPEWSQREHGPPPRRAHDALQRHDCLWRLLQRACAEDPADRFVDAEDMAEALRGVLGQVAAAVECTPKPHRSDRWGPPNTQLERLGWKGLPSPMLPGQPSLPNLFTGVAGADPRAAIEAAESAGGRLSWADRAVLVRAYCEVEALDAAAQAAAQIDPAADPGSGGFGGGPTYTTAVVEAARTYLRGVVALARGNAADAVRHFDAAYGAAPGEPACALALADALEASGDQDRLDEAEALYHQVATTDPTWVGAIAGRARVLQLLGRAQEGAVVLTRVPRVHPLRHEALTLACRTIPEGDSDPDVAEAARALVDTARAGHRDVREAKLAAAFYCMSLQALDDADTDGRSVLAVKAATALRDQAAGLPKGEREERHQLLDQAATLQPWSTWGVREQ